MEVARQKNANPLPMIPEKFGVRLPPERYCLTGTNYKIKSRKREVRTEDLCAVGKGSFHNCPVM